MFSTALIPLLVVFVFYLIIAKDSPGAPAAKPLGNYLAVLKDFAALAVFAVVGLTMVKKRWRTTWGSAAMTSAVV